MAYFTKKDIEKKIKNTQKTFEKKNIRPLNQINQAILQLENEEEIVNLTWIEVAGNKPDIKNLSYARLTHDLYTDDRYVLDAYASVKEGKDTIEFILEKRQKDKKTEKAGNLLKEALKNKKKK